MEDIKSMTKEELLDYLESISKQLDNIALDQIGIAIEELQFLLENSIPKSKVKEKIEEFKERNCLTCGKCKNSDEYEELYNNYISCDVGMVINTLQELLEREGK